MKAAEKIRKHLDTHYFITSSEAAKKGINAMALSRLAKDGELSRIGHGVYAREYDWLTDDLKKYIVPCAIYPKAVICGISALTNYNLTDEEERATWLAIPSTQRITNPRYTTVRLSGSNYSLGITKHHFGTRVVRIYDVEKTVVDAFKHLSQEAAYKALNGYLKREDRSIKKLCDYGRQLRKPLDEIVTALTFKG